ncbi:MAG TPA: type III pantothenate kinase [Rhodanobacteraceae bacterium]|nr:type III pantothenate kinase [Rhodanobacteraceae bacterium]
MQLLIDLGNTRLKWALASSGTISARGALEHVGADIAAALENEWISLPSVRRIYVASVASLGFDVEIETFAKRRFGVDCEFLRSPATALGVRNAYPEPHRLGIDRFLALAAAHARQPGAQVLIGVGTAMTLDAIDKDGTHLGGWIVPSPLLMRESVLARTARVGSADGRLVEFGDNSADALYSGSLYAASGAAERFCANAARQFQTWPAVVLTGGGADEIAALLPGAERREDLTLEGLALWASAAESSDTARGAQ